MLYILLFCPIHLNRIVIVHIYFFNDLELSRSWTFNFWSLVKLRNKDRNHTPFFLLTSRRPVSEFWKISSHPRHRSSQFSRYSTPGHTLFVLVETSMFPLTFKHPQLIWVWERREKKWGSRSCSSGSPWRPADSTGVERVQFSEQTHIEETSCVLCNLRLQL